jgi:phage baseplate assembly protein gpV
VSFGATNVQLIITTLSFQGIWNFGPNSPPTTTLFFNNAFTFGTGNYTFNYNIAFLQGATISATLNPGQGTVAFYNSLTFTTNIVFYILPIINCTNGNFAFNGPFSAFLEQGVQIGACNVQVANGGNIYVSNPINIFGNVTLPSAVSLNFTNTQGVSYNIQSVATPPSSTLWGLTLSTQRSFGNGTLCTNGVEVTFAGGITLNSYAVVVSTGNGLFTFYNPISIADNVTISAQVAFPTASINIVGLNSLVQQYGVQWSGIILLRNSILSPSIPIYYGQTSLVILNGVNSINSLNFIIASPLTVNYLTNGVNPQADNATLLFNSGSTRSLAFSIQSANKVSVVFDEYLNLNTSISFTTAANGAITFRASGNYLFSCPTLQTFSFSGTLYFNNSNVRFTGLATYNFASNANIYVQGAVGSNPSGWNEPLNQGDSTVNIAQCNVYLITSTTFGPTIRITGALLTDDLDGNPFSVSKGLVLDSQVGDYRQILGLYQINANLTFNQNAYTNFPSNPTIVGYGSLTINGALTLGDNPNWFVNTVFPNGVAISAAPPSGVAKTLTLKEYDANYLHGFSVYNTITLNAGVTLILNPTLGTNTLTTYFYSATTIGGQGILSATNVVFNDLVTGTVTLSPLTLTLTTCTFTGAGAFNLNPADGNLNYNGNINAATTVTYSGANVNVLANSVVPSLFSFSANPVTFTGSFTLTFSGTRTLSTTFQLNPTSVLFNDTITIATANPFVSLNNAMPTITFLKNVLLSTSATIPQNVVLGNKPTTPNTETRGGNTLILSGNSVTVTATIVSGGGNIVSNKVGTNQVITGGGVIPPQWTFSSPINFNGPLNITGTQTITLNHQISGSVYFLNGLIFSSANTFYGSGTIYVQSSITSNYPVVIAPSLTLFTIGSSFVFNGNSVLNLNATYICQSQTTFSQSVNFGYNLLLSNTPNTVTFSTGCSWLGSSLVTFYRSSFIVAASTPVTPPLTFAYPNAANVFSGTQSLLYLQGSITISTPSVFLNGVSLGAITISSTQNNTLVGVFATSTLSFNSTTNPWIEPTVSFFGTLSQNIQLNGPVVLNGPTFTSTAGISGTAPNRVAIINSFSTSSSFTFNAPLQLYVTNINNPFIVTTSTANSQVYITNPSLFNPLGFTPPTFAFTIASLTTVRLSTTSPLTFTDATITGSGTLRVSSGTYTFRTITVNILATLWVDGSAITASNTIFNSNSGGSSPSIFQFTISSSTPTPLTTNSVIYNGAAVVSVINFNWSGSQVTAISATAASGNNVFTPITGSSGYVYSDTRGGANNANMIFSASTSPTFAPIPTQSNGPAPPVNFASQSQMISFTLLFALVFVIFF